MAIFPGLASVTFRRLSVAAVVDLAVTHKLMGIEWGGDLHVPHGDIQSARETRKRCADANIQTTAYGSYYQAGESRSTGLDFETVCETAQVLGTTTIRVWAGDKGAEVA